MAKTMQELAKLFSEFNLAQENPFTEQACCVCEEICALTIQDGRVDDMICPACATLFDYLRGLMGNLPYLHQTQGPLIAQVISDGVSDIHELQLNLFTALNLTADARIYEETRYEL